MQQAIQPIQPKNYRLLRDEFHSDQRGVTTIEWITLGCVLIVLLMIFFTTFQRGGETLATQIIDGLAGLQVAFDGNNTNSASHAGEAGTGESSQGSDVHQVGQGADITSASPTSDDSSTNEDELGFGDQVLGVFKGIGKTLWGAGEGIVVLAYDGAVLTSPVIAPIVYATNPDYYHEKLDKYKQVGQAIWDNPGDALYAMVEHVVEPWKEGRYGEAIGAGITEILLFWVPGDEFGKAGTVASAAAKLDKAVPDEILAKLAHGERLTPDEAAQLAKASDQLSPDELAQLQKALPCSFSAETLVTTSTGLKAISALAVGEIVLAYHEGQNEVGYYPIIATMEHLDPVVVWLQIDGERVETTPEHPFYTTENRWVPAGKLQVGQFIRQANGGSGVIQAVEVVQVPQVMYNLTVDDAHTFFVGQRQWLVHNQCAKKIANGHAYEKHVIEKGEFPEINSPEEFEHLVKGVMKSPESKPLSNGRHAYWKDDTVVITDPNHIDGGTAFRPTAGKAYYDNLQ